MIFALNLFGTIVLVAAAYVYLSGLGSRPKNCPPGPPTVPVIGNIHQIPKKDMHLKLTEWASEYGPIYSILLGSQVMIVLSSAQTVKDLLDNRGGIYSDRPDLYIVKHVPTGQLRVLSMRYGKLWRTLRKVMHSLLGAAVSTDYIPYQMLERKQMLNELLDDPDDFFRSIHRYATSVVTSLTFGWRTPDHDNPRAELLYQEVRESVKVITTGSAALLDAFPLFGYLPELLLPIKTQIRYAFDLTHKCHMGNWDLAKRQIAEKTIKPCLCAGLANAQKRDGISEEEAAYTAGTVFEGGAETTADTIYAFVQAMLLFPNVQAKAQAEIEKVVGAERLPTFADAPNLPYVRCCVKELLRWMPASPLGAFPHSNTREDTYMGYTIPKGALVINNVWAIHMDPQHYPEPRRFAPERFENDDDSSSVDSIVGSEPSKRDIFPFGAGRRICPGMHVADQSLFIAVSGLLWAFDVRPKKDELGEDILPDVDDLIVTVDAIPAPFVADIKPRGEKRKEMIRREWEDAKGMLDPSTMQWKETPEEIRMTVLKA